MGARCDENFAAISLATLGTAANVQPVASKSAVMIIIIVVIITVVLIRERLLVRSHARGYKCVYKNKYERYVIEPCQ